jgi:hypothetical protein
MRAKRRIYVEKEKRLSTSYLLLLIILDFGYFSEWFLCPGGSYAPMNTVVRFLFFLTAGHLPHSNLVADQDFLTAEAKNAYNYSRNFSVREMPHRRNSIGYSTLRR